MGRGREKVKSAGPDEWRIACEYIFRYINGAGKTSEYKLAGAVRHKGKVYEAFIVIKERGNNGT
jgi:hypothetical protein